MCLCGAGRCQPAGPALVSPPCSCPVCPGACAGTGASEPRSGSARLLVSDARSFGGKSPALCAPGGDGAAWLSLALLSSEKRLENEGLLLSLLFCYWQLSYSSLSTALHRSALSARHRRCLARPGHSLWRAGTGRASTGSPQRGCSVYRVCLSQCVLSHPRSNPDLPLGCSHSQGEKIGS